MNQMTMCGNLGRDFEVLQSKNGSVIAKNSLAITEKRKVGNDTIEHTDWIPIVIFGKRAEVASQYFKKGDKFLATGKIYTYEYDDENGNRKYGWQMIVRDFTFVGQKREAQANIPTPPQVIYESAPKNLEEAEVINSTEAEQEIPF
ncbi:single-stranded DNA-binding protein [Helicobacter sp. MIT 11-5569]|uniref:single-stranded DNA-binding protein n=1 Tax=Helicobacter sp. MIT 11-5569 TaxID=1548151 RepID=UPI00051FD21E|nr:single-stranded DNA-binding protein [Helicobacter sp. MIT 11-5569]TLD85185.1 single-stranded DNA-binding protein [Helicobacter sp. MIT 11-5569]